MSAGYISVVNGNLTLQITISVSLKTAKFCLNLELITSQNGVDYSVSYEMVNNIKKKKNNKKKHEAKKKRFFFNNTGCKQKNN